MPFFMDFPEAGSAHTARSGAKHHESVTWPYMTHKRHPSARRKPTDKHEEEDAFIEKVLEISAWAREHRQLLVTGVIILGVVIASAMYYRSYQIAIRTQAINELEEIQQTVGLGDPETSVARLDNYLLRFGETRYGMEARLVLGQLQLEQLDPEAAVTTLLPAVSQLDDPVATQAAFLLCSAYEQLGRASDAEELYLRLADHTDLGFQFREALAGAARIRLTRGDAAGAAELYQRVLDSLEETDAEWGLYEMRLAEARERS